MDVPTKPSRTTTFSLVINLAPKSEISLASILDGEASDTLGVRSKSPGPAGSLPLDDAMLRDWSSGDLFGLSQNAGMGWKPEEMVGPQYLILSTQGGLRAPDGTPIALGYHTGHWEVGLLVEAAARELKQSGGVPFAGYCSDPCDGRTQGTVGMFDSLPFRNDAAVIFRRMIRSLPTRRGVIGVATCDKGLPAMMMALAGTRDLPCVLIPGGVTLPPEQGEDAAKIQTIGARYVHGEITPGRSRRPRLPRLRLARRRLPVPRHRGHVAGDRRSARPFAAAFGACPQRPADLARHGPPLRAGTDATRSARHSRSRHSYRRGPSQRHGRSRRVRRLDQPAVARAGDRARRRASPAHGPRLGRRQPPARRALSMPCPTAPSAIPPCRYFSPEACPRSCFTSASWACST